MARNRMTLLEIVQRVLDAMNHDTVTDITDTPESEQIAEEARITYYDLMDRGDWPHLHQLLPLDDNDLAGSQNNMLKIPENVVRIDGLKYEVTESGDGFKTWDRITYLEPEDFIDLVHLRKTSESNVETITNANGVPMYILNDTAPTYWTTFDDEYIVFDAYDATVDASGLQGSKSLVTAKVIPTWTESNSFVPDMPDQMFSVFISELTAACFTYWKQGASVKDEQRAARGIARLRKDARKADEQSYKVSYGRRRPRVVRSADGDRGSAFYA